MRHRRAALYTFLALLFLSASALQCVFLADAVSRGPLADRIARPPFSYRLANGVILELQPEADRAGVRPGDRFLAVEGRPVTGVSPLEQELTRLGPGAALRVTIARGAGAVSAEAEATILLAPRRDRPAGASDWQVALLLHAVMPFLCLALGFWSAAIRPHDPLAWLLLALMMSFSQLTAYDPYHHHGLLRDAAVAYHKLCTSTWFIWMLLFGIHFPERWEADRRFPWARWILLIPLAGQVVTEVVLGVSRGERYADALPLAQLIARIQSPLRIVSMMAIGLFFMALGWKFGTATGPDARRRLGVLMLGTQLSLSPMFVAVLYAMATGQDLFAGIPAGLVTFILLMLLLFPLTFSYVIVVHRALDVRVVIRQGLQYALAKGGVVALRVILTLAIVVGMILLLSRPNTRRVEVVAVVGWGVGLFVVSGHLAEWLRRWIDRRFFREAYDAEQILAELSEQVRTLVETEPLLHTVARRLSESLHVPRVAVLVQAGPEQPYLPARALGWEIAPDVRFEEGSATVAHLRQTSEPARVYLDDPASWIYRAGVGASERAALQQLDSQLLLPLSVKDRLPGFISLGPRRAEAPYAGSDLRQLRAVATQAGLALENSRLTEAVATEAAQRERMTRELEIAREVQERLFPQNFPQVPGLDYAGHCRPALGVGGDYFDFLPLPGGMFAMVIGDVSGKGIGAALMMASLQASLRGQTIRGAGDLALLMGTLNGLIFGASPDNRYATLFLATFEPSSRRLAYVNAGHCPPMVIRRTPAGAVDRLGAGGTVVGLFPETGYRESAIQLGPGDLLIAYTDGISEALNPQEEEWGEEQLLAAARGCDGLPARATLERLMAQADRFTAGAPQHDDMTLLVARIL